MWLLKRINRVKSSAWKGFEKRMHDWPTAFKDLHCVAKETVAF